MNNVTFNQQAIAHFSRKLITSQKQDIVVGHPYNSPIKWSMRPSEDCSGFTRCHGIFRAFCIRRRLSHQDLRSL